MDFDQLYPGRFMKAGEFRDGKGALVDVTLTIKKVELDELEGKKGKETKALMTFQETEKALVLNKTNGTAIKAMFGRNTDAWIGKRVSFYPANIQFEDSDLAIRVRGSPDLQGQIQIDTMIGRKKYKATLVRTGAKQRPAQPNQPKPANGANGPQQPAPAAAPLPGHVSTDQYQSPEPPDDLPAEPGANG